MMSCVTFTSVQFVLRQPRVHVLDPLLARQRVQRAYAVVRLPPLLSHHRVVEAELAQADLSVERVQTVAPTVASCEDHRLGIFGVAPTSALARVRSAMGGLLFWLAAQVEDDGGHVLGGAGRRRRIDLEPELWPKKIAQG